MRSRFVGKQGFDSSAVHKTFFFSLIHFHGAEQKGPAWK